MSDSSERIERLKTQLENLEQVLLEPLELIDLFNREQPTRGLKIYVNGQPREWPVDSEPLRVALGMIRRFRKSLDAGKITPAECDRIAEIMEGLQRGEVNDG